MNQDLKDQLKNLFPDHVESEPEVSKERSAQQEPLLCKYEKKGRNGKPVTIIEGFLGNADELKALSKKIKKSLGIGGSEKEGTIIIQGDNREKIMQILKTMGFKTKRIGG